MGSTEEHSRHRDGNHRTEETPIAPNSRLPNGNPGYSLLGISDPTTGAQNIEVLVGLAPGCEQLYLTDPEAPELDPNCPSG